MEETQGKLGGKAAEAVIQSLQSPRLETLSQCVGLDSTPGQGMKEQILPDRSFALKMYKGRLRKKYALI